MVLSLFHILSHWMLARFRYLFDFHVNILVLSLRIELRRKSSSIDLWKLVEKVPLRFRDIADIMAPPRKSDRSLRSGSAHEHEATSPTPHHVGVTREELDAVVAGIHQQMESQNNAMLEKLTAMLTA